jgi:hypothetical protein
VDGDHFTVPSLNTSDIHVEQVNQYLPMRVGSVAARASANLWAVQVSRIHTSVLLEREGHNEVRQLVEEVAPQRVSISRVT